MMTYDDPTQVTTKYWIVQRGPTEFSSSDESGKWVLRVKPAGIVDAWSKVQAAVADGDLVCAKTSTKKFKLATPGLSVYIICVYTREWSNFDEHVKTLAKLRTLGFTEPLKYKRDLDTVRGVKRYALTSEQTTEIKVNRGYAKHLRPDQAVPR